MRSISLVILSVACIFANLPQPDCVADEKKKDDKDKAKKLDGKWYVARQEERGNLVPAIVSKRLTMVIDGNKMEWYIGNPAPNFAATITIGRPEVKLGDAIRLRGVPDDDANGSFQVRSVAHRLRKDTGFTTEIGFRGAGDSGGGVSA